MCHWSETKTFFFFSLWCFVWSFLRHEEHVGVKPSSDIKPDPSNAISWYLWYFRYLRRRRYLSCRAASRASVSLMFSSFSHMDLISRWNLIYCNLLWQICIQMWTTCVRLEIVSLRVINITHGIWFSAAAIVLLLVLWTYRKLISFTVTGFNLQNQLAWFILILNNHRRSCSGFMEKEEKVKGNKTCWFCGERW